MKKISIFIGFAFLTIFISILEVATTVSPIIIFQHFRTVLIFFIISLLLTNEVFTIITLPLALVILEQFTFLPYGVLSLALLSALTTTTILLKLVLNNRSITTISIVSVAAVFVYKTVIVLFLSTSENFNSFFEIVKIYRFSFLLELLSTWLAVLIFYILFSRFSRRWNPRYVKHYGYR